MPTTEAARRNSPIDWRRAQRAAEFVAARAETPSGRFGADVEAICAECREQVVDYTRLKPRGKLAAAVAVSRNEWIAANLEGLGNVLERPLGKYLEARGGDSRLLSATANLSGILLGAEIGGLMGYFSTRVLGQYHLVLGAGEGMDRPEPCLLYVRPNLIQARRKLRVPNTEFLRWISFHEVCHSVQFSSCSWLEAELGQLVDTYVERVSDRIAELSPARLLEPFRDPRKLLEALRSGSLVELLTPASERSLLERAQAIMTLIEGHAEHVMHALGEHQLPHYRRLAGMAAARRRRGAPERLLQRLLGLELKFRQYEEGRHFVDEIVELEGIKRFNRVWKSPDMLPTAAEIADPKLWLTRT